LKGDRLPKRQDRNLSLNFSQGGNSQRWLNKSPACYTCRRTDGLQLPKKKAERLIFPEKQKNPLRIHFGSRTHNSLQNGTKRDHKRQATTQNTSTQQTRLRTNASLGTRGVGWGRYFGRTWPVDSYESASLFWEANCRRRGSRNTGIWEDTRSMICRITGTAPS